MRLAVACFLFFSLFSSLSTRAQDTEVVFRGQVIRAKHRTPIECGFVYVTKRGSVAFWKARIQSGLFSMSIPSGEGYHLMIDARGFAGLQSMDLAVYQGMDSQTFLLEQYLALEGRVLDSQGVGIVGATVATLDSEGDVKKRSQNP